MKLQVRSVCQFTLAVAALFGSSLHAQSIYGTLTGVVSDPSGAVVTGAKLQLKDQQSGSLRDSVSNNDGFYTFISVPPGAYQLTITASGFETLKQTGIAILGGDKINVTRP